jgi:hypothetical protein
MSDILTAIEKALENTNTGTQYPDSPLTAELFRIIEDPTKSHKLLPAAVYADMNPIRGAYAVRYTGVFAEYSQKTLLAAIGQSQLTTPETASRLCELEKSIREHYSEMGNYSAQKANDLLYAQSRKLATQIVDGRLPEVAPLRTREQVHTDFRLKRDAIEIAVIPLREEAQQLARPIIVAAKNLVWNHLAALEQDERQIADSYGVLYVPSYHWRALAAAAVNISPDRVKQQVYPSAMLAGFITLS